MDNRRQWLSIVAVLWIALLAGCPKKSGARAPSTGQQVEITSFSDASPVRLIVAAPPYVFSASERGLDRWDPASGQVLELSAEHGLPGDRVEAMTFDESRGILWVATDGGMTRYNVKQGIFMELPPPPSILGLKSFVHASLHPAGDGGVWIGHKRGLFYTNPQGLWNETGITEPVAAVLRTRDGWLWIGAESGLIGRRPDGESIRFDRTKGCDVATIRFMAEAPGSTPVIVGENKDGEQRIVLVLDGKCVSYRAAPNELWLAATRRPDELVVLTEDGIYALSAAKWGARSLSREGMRLLPVPLQPDAVPPKSPFVMRSLEVSLPEGSHSLAAMGDEILVGTPSQGTARLSEQKPQKRRWLRRSDLVEDALSLTVACRTRTDCYLATGGYRSWRYNGRSFTRVEIEGLRILAFVRSQSGDIHALTRNAENTKIIAYRNVDETWRQVTGLAIEVPGRKPVIGCARFAPSGLLWIGLEYEDESGDSRSYGTAVADINLGVVIYHRASASDKDAREGVLPIPIGVKDMAFLEDEVWLATNEGAAVVRENNDVQVFSEVDGLRSELLRGVAVSPGGIVFTASDAGVGSYDGSAWTFPKMLRLPVNDVEMGPDGRLWLATNQGVAMFDGAKVRKLDTRRGLLQNEIDEIRIDAFGRIWARGSQGISIISP